MNTSSIAVLGHVDHGKTSLVRALTGIETDNLQEEKSRGLSITPGFAHRIYPTGILDFIDLPGHEDFIQAMVSGSTGARFILGVISATEGVSAQTLEHLRIAALLGITHGVIAITKSDLLSQTEQVERAKEIKIGLAQTTFGNLPLVICSAHKGIGISNLHVTLQSLLSYSKNILSPLHHILPIDRVFSQTGSGTIVTGTLLGQKISIDDTVTLLPEGRSVTLRGLQSRGETRETINVGERMAANLRGVSAKDITRGAVLAVGNTVAASRCFDISIKLLPTSLHPLKHMEDVRLLFGTSSEVASIRLFGDRRIAKGQQSLAQIRFKSPVVGFAGQRIILRRLSPPQTIGGAIILDPIATPVKSGDKARVQVLKATQTGDAFKIALSISQSNGGVAKLSHVARLAQMTVQSTRKILNDAFTILDPDLVAAKLTIEACKTDIIDKITSFHTKNPRRSLAPRKIIETRTFSPILLKHAEKALLANGEIRDQGTRMAIISHDPLAMLSQIERNRLTEIEKIFSISDLKPPKNSQIESNLDNDLVDLLIDTGRLIVLQNISLNQTLVFHADALIKAANDLQVAFPTLKRFTTGEARIILNTTRRIIIPLLEYFDKIGITLRTGNQRQIAAANSVSSRKQKC